MCVRRLSDLDGAAVVSRWVDVDVVVKYVYVPLFVPGFLFLYFNMLRARARRGKKAREQRKASDGASEPAVAGSQDGAARAKKSQ